jgi:cytochrome b6-f complex iron-sulfur subunit
MSELSRRDFLKLASQGLLALGGMIGLGMLARFLGWQADPPPQTEFDLGPASAFPPGSRTLLAQVPAVLFHTDTGFSALSLVCTHLGCTLEEQEEGFACPCHGSRFDTDGAVLRGPAKKALVSLRLEQRQEHLFLFTD